MFRSRQACCHHAKYKRKLAFALCTSPSMLQRQARGEACVGHVHIQPLSVVVGLRETATFPSLHGGVCITAVLDRRTI